MFTLSYVPYLTSKCIFFKWHDNLIKLSVCLKPTERRIVDKKSYSNINTMKTITNCVSHRHNKNIRIPKHQRTV